MRKNQRFFFIIILFAICGCASNQGQGNPLLQPASSQKHLSGKENPFIAKASFSAQGLRLEYSNGQIEEIAKKDLPRTIWGKRNSLEGKQIEIESYAVFSAEGEITVLRAFSWEGRKEIFFTPLASQMGSNALP